MSFFFAGKDEFLTKDCKILPLAINKLIYFPVFSHGITWFHQTDFLCHSTFRKTKQRCFFLRYVCFLHRINYHSSLYFTSNTEFPPKKQKRGGRAYTSDHPWPWTRLAGGRWSSSIWEKMRYNHTINSNIRKSPITKLHNGILYKKWFLTEPGTTGIPSPRLGEVAWVLKNLQDAHTQCSVEAKDLFAQKITREKIPIRSSLQFSSLTFCWESVTVKVTGSIKKKIRLLFESWSRTWQKCAKRNCTAISRNSCGTRKSEKKKMCQNKQNF